MNHKICKCLIVEDLKDWRDIFKETVEEGNCKAALASSLQEARALIEREFFHVAVVDLNLVEESSSDRSGLTVMGWLRDLDEGTKPVLITAKGSLKDGFEVATSFGGLGVIAKNDFATNRQQLIDLLATGFEAASHNQARLAEEAKKLLLNGRMSVLWESEVSEALKKKSKSGPELVYTLFYLLSPTLAPFRAPLDGNVSVIEKERGIVRASLWSRGAGQPVQFVIGPKSTIKEELQGLPPERIIAKEERVDLTGFAAIAPARRFEDFRPAFKPVEQKTGSFGR